MRVGVGVATVDVACGFNCLRFDWFVIGVYVVLCCWGFAPLLARLCRVGAVWFCLVCLFAVGLCYLG